MRLTSVIASWYFDLKTVDFMTFIPYAKQSISEDDLEEVKKALEGPVITRGPLVHRFENEMAEYCGARYAVAFSSGSAALAGAYYAAKAGPHDRIFTTPNTFVSSVGTGMQRGSSPVFIDLDPATGSFDLQSLLINANQPTTRGRSLVMAVHFGGLPIDMEKMDAQLTNPDVIVIEDAAHAIGTRYPRGGPRIGSCAWSHLTAFSFHPVKNITTGEGGLVTTNDPELHHRLLLFRGNGIEREPERFEGEIAPWKYEVQDITNNFHLTDFQAALGLSQLKRLEEFIEKRRLLIKRYREKLQGEPHIHLLTDAYDEHTAFHLCVSQIDFEAAGKTRAEVMTRLKEEGIGTQVHYIPLYHHPYFKRLSGEISEYFPHTESYYKKALSLPLYYDLSLEEVDRVVTSLVRCMQG